MSIRNFEPHPEWMKPILTKLDETFLALGFSDWGISDTELLSHPAHLTEWLDRQDHGDMAWMKNHKDLREAPQSLHANTLRVISVRMDYLPTSDALPTPKDLHNWGEAPIHYPVSTNAWISRYALGRDYHKKIRNLLKKAIQQLNQHLLDQSLTCKDTQAWLDRYPQSARPFVDSAPVLERAFAEKGALGWIGKNTMLIHPKAGSWFFLGEIFSPLPLPATLDIQPDRCGSCQRCLEACPTGAFRGARQLDAKRCISYLTIEHQGSIPVALRPLIGNRIFGCDDCQIVCPWNESFAKPSVEEDFSPRHKLDQIQLAELLTWSEQEYLSNTEGSPIRRLGYEKWTRNLAVACGNIDREDVSPLQNSDLIHQLIQKRQEASPMVQEHIDWALSRLSNQC